MGINVRARVYGLALSANAKINGAALFDAVGDLAFATEAGTVKRQLRMSVGTSDNLRERICPSSF